MKNEKRKEEEQEMEREIRKRDAQKYFDSWKAKKDDKLKEQHHKKVEERKQKKKLEEEEKDDKRKSATKVFENWYAKIYDFRVFSKFLTYRPVLKIHSGKFKFC